jgi:hypothetical protein
MVGLLLSMRILVRRIVFMLSGVLARLLFLAGSADVVLHHRALIVMVMMVVQVPLFKQTVVVVVCTLVKLLVQVVQVVVVLVVTPPQVQLMLLAVVVVEHMLLVAQHLVQQVVQVVGLIETIRAFPQQVLLTPQVAVGARTLVLEAQAEQIVEPQEVFLVVKDCLIQVRLAITLKVVFLTLVQVAVVLV